MANVIRQSAHRAAGDAMQRSDLAVAERLLVAHLATDPNDADGLIMLAAVRHSFGRINESAELLDRAVAADPDNIDARLSLIDLALADNRSADALDQLRHLPESVRCSFELMAREAELLSRVGEHEQEVALYHKLMAMRPDIPGLWVSMANALRTLGRNDEAVQALRRAIAIQPDYVRPWWHLADLKNFRFDESDIAAMTALLDSQLTDADRIPLHFALGKAFEDRGEAQAAFDHYAAGNARRAISFGRERIGITAKADRVVETFTADFFEARAGWGHESDAPIFIVGLQRSGSTLIEQILASHPQIEGTSELPIMSQVMRDIATDNRLAPGHAFERLALLDRDQVRAYGQLYLDRAAAFRHSDRPRFIDKLPGNWSNIGLIRLILPRAIIIDARRHPMATGLSNFQQNFGDGAFFSYSLSTIGDYYRQYLRVVSHFERAAPGAIYRVVNERLIAEFDPQVRALLDHVGVAFDPACLEFYRTNRAIRTPSSAQVRRPINRDGVDRWRLFEPMLGELKQALGPALDGWNLPPGTYRDEEQ